MIIVQDVSKVQQSTILVQIALRCINLPLTTKSLLGTKNLVVYE